MVGVAWPPKVQFVVDKFTTLSETDRGQMRSRLSTFAGSRGNVSIDAVKPDRLVTQGCESSKVRECWLMPEST